MAFPVAPKKTFDFTNYSTLFPTKPQDGTELDRQFQEVIRAASETIASLALIQRNDGRLANQSVHLETLAPDVLGKIIASVTPNLSASLTASASYAAQAAASATNAQTYVSLVQAAEQDATTAASDASYAKIDAENAALIAASAATAAANAQTFTRNAENNAKTSENKAHMSAEMAMAWAEYLPDTIPPRYFPDNSITGDHWSARWWANKATNAFGFLTSLYLGVHPDHATAIASVTNPPIAVGSIYYNSTNSQPFIWTGSGWSAFWQPQKAITTTLYYVPLAAQKDFVLSTADLNALSFTLDKVDTEPLEVFLNGVRLLPGSDYTVDPIKNTVSFAQNIPAAAVVTIDILTPPSKMANGTVNFRALLDIDLDPVTRAPGRIDGVRNTFSLARADGQPLTMGSAVELLVSVDGIIQHAGTDYNILGSRVVFTDPPRQDSKVWALWMEPGGSGGAKGVQPPLPPDDLHVNGYVWNPLTSTAEWADTRKALRGVVDTAARLRLKDPDELVAGSLVYETATRDIWVYTPSAAPTPSDPLQWKMLLPGHPTDNIRRALQYDPSAPNVVAWEDSRDDPETVGTVADLSNRLVLPLSHLGVGKLVYVRADGMLYECLVDGATGTPTNTLADWKPLGGAGVTYVGRIGNLPDPASVTVPDGSLFMVGLDLNGNTLNRFYAFDAKATNAIGVTGIYRPIASKDYYKALRADPDAPLDAEPGDIQNTLEKGHAEIKVFDAAGAWQTIYSEDIVKQWIAASNLFQGTVQNKAYGTVGAVDLDKLPAQSALGITDAGHYYIYVGLAGKVITANDIGGAVSNIDGAKLNVGDWILVANTGTATVPVMKYTHIPGDLLAKSRGDSLYGLNAWTAGAYEPGSLVVYLGDIYKANRAALPADVGPGVAVIAPATNPWTKVDLSGGVKNVAADTNLPATAANGAVYLVLSSAKAGGKQALYSWDTASNKWQSLGGSGVPLDLTGGKKLVNYGTPIGTVITYAGKTLPAGYLLCDGSAFDGTVYPELQKALGGTTLPDLRSQFIRGAANLAAVNFTKHDATTARPKTAFTGVTNRAGAHVHDFFRSGAAWSSQVQWNDIRYSPINSQGTGSPIANGIASSGAHEHTVTVNGGGDAETAPAHVILAMLIKATDVAVVEGT